MANSSKLLDVSSRLSAINPNEYWILSNVSNGGDIMSILANDSYFSRHESNQEKLIPKT